MKIMVYSRREAQESQIGWHRDGFNISYFKSNIQREEDLGYEASYYTLTFCYRFEHDGDEVFFAYNYPYTYTELQAYLENIESNPSHQKIFKRNLLCRTLAGNRVDLITISQPK